MDLLVFGGSSPIVALQLGLSNSTVPGWRATFLRSAVVQVFRDSGAIGSSVAYFPVGSVPPHQGFAYLLVHIYEPVLTSHEVVNGVVYSASDSALNHGRRGQHG